MYDKDCFSDPVKAKAFADSINNLDLVYLEVENNSHCPLFEQHVHDMLLSCFL